MIAERLDADPRVLLVGAVRGVVAETYPVIDELERFHPERLGLGLSPEEMKGLQEYFVDAEAETTVHLIDTETSEVRALSRWGEVRVPNPVNVRALEWARHRGVALSALDPPDEGAAQMFTAHIGYVELVRRTLREKSLSRAPPKAENPDDFALRWDAQLAVGRGSRDLAANRDRYFTEGARELLKRSARVALVVDRERFALVRSLLSAPNGAVSRRP